MAEDNSDGGPRNPQPPRLKLPNGPVIEVTWDNLIHTNTMPLPVAAEFYAMLGLVVIPLDPGTKVPLRELRQGWTRRGSKDPNVVREWWRVNPDANIGIIAGPESGICILDLDNKKNSVSGIALFAGTHEAAGGPAASTPNSGAHRIFQHRDGLTNKSPKGKGFDLLVRAKQVVVAPSKVQNSDGQIMAYRWTASGAPQPLPDAVLAKIAELEASTDKTDKAGDAPARPALGLVIDHPFTDLDRSDRSTYAFNLAALLYRWKAAHEMTQADVLATLWADPDIQQAALSRRQSEDGALAWLWEYCAWPPSNLQVTFPPDSGYDPRIKPDPQPWDNDQADENDLPDINTGLSVTDILERYDSPPDYLIPQWLPRGVPTSLFGQDGTGKTMFVQRLATCLAAGRPVMTRPEGPKLNVLMLLTEDTMPAIAERQRKICSELGVAPSTLNDNLIFPDDLLRVDVKMQYYDRDGRVSLSGFALWLKAFLRQHPRLDLLVLDPISDVYADEENVRHRVVQFMRLLTEIAQEFDIAVLLIGHPAKSDGSEYSGSTAWSSKSRSRWFMKTKNKNIGSPVILQHQKASYGPKANDITMVWSEYNTLKDVTASDSEALQETELDEFDTHIRGFLIDAYEKDQELFHMRNNVPDTYLPNVLIARGQNLRNDKDDLVRLLNLLVDRRGSIGLATKMTGEAPGLPRARKSNGTGFFEAVWPSEGFRPQERMAPSLLGTKPETTPPAKGPAANKPNAAGIIPEEVEKAKNKDGNYGW